MQFIDTYYHEIGNTEIAVEVLVNKWSEPSEAWGVKEHTNYTSVDIKSFSVQTFKNATSYINLKSSIVAEIQEAADDYYSGAIH